MGGIGTNTPIQHTPMFNITRVVPVDLSEGDFTDEYGFFIRCESGGLIKYCPVGNTDEEAITKEIEASVYFIDPERCRKIFALEGSPTPASDIYIGYGV